jgi:hypothetical protein
MLFILVFQIFANHTVNVENWQSLEILETNKYRGYLSSSITK